MPEGGAEGPRLLAGAAALEVALDDRQVDALLAFGAEIRRWNRAFNLVSRRDVGRLLSRHLLDSLSAAPRLAGQRVLDLGTGAGLPGVPLAIVRPQMHFTLVDRNARRIRFVGQACRRLGLANVEPVCADAAALPGTAVFDTVVTRAVAGLEVLWGMAEPRLAPGGRLVLLHRAGDKERPAEQDTAPAGAMLEERYRVELPELAHPHEQWVLVRAEGDGQRTPAGGRKDSRSGH